VSRVPGPAAEAWALPGIIPSVYTIDFKEIVYFISFREQLFDPLVISHGPFEGKRPDYRRCLRRVIGRFLSFFLRSAIMRFVTIIVRKLSHIGLCYLGTVCCNYALCAALAHCVLHESHRQAI